MIVSEFSSYSRKKWQVRYYKSDPVGPSSIIEGFLRRDPGRKAKPAGIAHNIRRVETPNASSLTLPIRFSSLNVIKKATRKIKRDQVEGKVPSSSADARLSQPF